MHLFREVNRPLISHCPPLKTDQHLPLPPPPPLEPFDYSDQSSVSVEEGAEPDEPAGWRRWACPPAVCGGGGRTTYHLFLILVWCYCCYNPRSHWVRGRNTPTIHSLTPHGNKESLIKMMCLVLQLWESTQRNTHSACTNHCTAVTQFYTVIASQFHNFKVFVISCRRMIWLNLIRDLRLVHLSLH